MTEWNTGVAGTNNVSKKIGVSCGINTYIQFQKQNDVRILATAQKCSSSQGFPQVLRTWGRGGLSKIWLG